MSSPVVNLSLSLREARMVMRALSECGVLCFDPELPWHEQCEQWQVVSGTRSKIEYAVADSVSSVGVSRVAASKVVLGWYFEGPRDAFATKRYPFAKAKGVA